MATGNLSTNSKSVFMGQSYQHGLYMISLFLLDSHKELSMLPARLMWPLNSWAFGRISLTPFSMQGYKVYITGESYAGQYIPYIASAMLDAEDCEYYDVKGVQINEPSINYDDVMIQGE